MSERRKALWAKFVEERGARYGGCSFESFHCGASTKTDQKKQAAVRSQLENLDLSNWAGITNMIFYGGWGTGKDHLLTACVRKLIKTTHIYDYRQKRFRLPTIRWIHGQKLFGEKRDGIDDKTSEKSFINSFVNVDLLTMSDVATAERTLTDSQKDTLYWIIDDRYSRNLPTWITLNAASAKDLDDRLGRSCSERFIHDALGFFFDWETYRKPRT